MASIKVNTAYNTLLSILNVLFPFITAPYISRVLGVENIGVVNFATSYAAYFVLFATLGVPRYGIRAIAEKGENVDARNKTFSELFWLISLSSIIVTAAYVISVFTIDKLYDERLYLLIAGFTVLTASFNIEWYFSGRENFKLITVRSLIVKLISISGLFIFVRDAEDVVPYMLLSTGVIVINQFWNWSYFLRKDRGCIKCRDLEFKPHAQPLFTLFASSVSISIYTMLDTLMLGFLSNYSQVGYYTQAMKLSKIVLPITTSMAPVIFARISALKDSGDETEIKRILSNSFSYMYTLALPITIGMFIIAPAFVPWFFGEEFVPSVILLQILSPLVLIIGISNLYGIQIVQAMGRDKAFLVGVICGTIVNFILNLILIRTYGAIGASIASVVAEISVTCVMFVVSLRILRLDYNIKTIIQPILGCLPMFGLYIFVSRLELSHFEILSILIPSSAITYGLLMLMMRNNVAIRVMTPLLIRIGLK